MGMKIRYVPGSVNQKCNLPSVSFSFLPVTFGNHRYVAVNIPKIAATPITRWKWAGTKYVLWRYRSTEGCARNSPESPPETNSVTNPIAYSIADVNRICPPHSVPSQLNVLIAEGTPIAMVISEKANPVYGLIPLRNM